MPALLAMVGALSLTVTKVVDLVRNLIDKNDSFPKYTWNIVALVVGIGFALGWQLNIAGSVTSLIPALKNATLTGVSGQLLTGAVIGMASGFWHEVLDSLSSVANKNNAPRQ